MFQSELVQHTKGRPNRTYSRFNVQTLQRFNGFNVSCLLSLSIVLSSAGLILAQSHAPYPPSPAIRSISWLWETRQTAAIGSDLWPVTWGPDNHLYAAWGDGGGFGGSDSDGRVAMGIAR